MAEMELVRLNYELEYVKAMLSIIIEGNVSQAADLDAGKWYQKKQNKPDIPNN